MKRLCIYLTYDKQKVIDKYIGYMLRELSTCVDYLAVVCNELEVARGLEIIKEYADKIFYRENVGFDIGGFKDALCNLVGWEKVLQYDELVLVNDSIFGPFKPMNEIFREMSKKNVDFWGLSQHGEVPESKYGYVTNHIQSFFTVVRFRMLHCDSFQRYWEELPYFSTYEEAVGGHEIKFSQFFGELGYTFTSLANTKINDSSNIHNNFNQYAFLSLEMIKKRNFPFLKKQSLILETLYVQTQENLRMAIDYIDKNTDYDVNLIWDNIIRIFNMSDLQKSLHLQYIIPDFSPKTTHGRIAVLIFVSYKNSFEYIMEYIQDLKSKYEIIIFSEKKDCLKIYRENGFKCKTIELSDIRDILVRFSIYDFVAVLHDTDMSSDEKPSMVGKSYFYNIWENLVKSHSHMLGILDQFFEESRLGFLAAPQPNFEKYFGAYGDGWNGHYEKVSQILKRLDLKCQISSNTVPFRITNDFWIRGCILEKLKYMEFGDIVYLPYMWIYLVQDAGYYSGIVESTEYASMNEVNLQYYLQQITSLVRYYYGDFNDFEGLKRILNLSALKEYCGKHSEVFIYGTGAISNLYRNFVPNIKAYIVSDGQNKLEYLDGIPVKYLSEIEVKNNCGVVLCLDAKNQQEVIVLLDKYGIQDYFSLWK